MKKIRRLTIKMKEEEHYASKESPPLIPRSTIHVLVSIHPIMTKGDVSI